MPSFEVIRAVSKTLEKVLTEALSVLPSTPAPRAELNDLQFTSPPTNPLLTIFLFEAGEDPSARNRPRIRESVPPTLTLKKPPMALLLRYLLTPWGGNQETQQLILGRALQTLYDKAILSGPDLEGELAGTDEALKVTMSPLSLEERTRVWHAVQKPYRLSVSYEVRVINLDSEVSNALALTRRRSLDYEE
ncbi:MAG TPA: DUF4255 domain-containing protein [Blastocatellia bacterium]|nr:DUF4255 domain-containing protein [Blastocatellia bacterium]